MATWKKVLVSGSAVEVADLLATGTNITFSGLGASNGNVLQIDADGSITAVASDSVGGGGNLNLSGSNANGVTLNVSTQDLHFDSTNGVTIEIDETGGSGTEPQITINTPQDLQDTAAPTFQSLVIQDDDGTPTITIKDPSDSAYNGNIAFTSEGDLVFTAGTNTKLAFYGQGNDSDRYIHVNPGDGAGDRRDINFIASGKFDKHLFVVDASASFSSSAGETAGRGKVGVGLGDDGFILLNDVDNEVTKDAVLVVSGNVAVVGGNITASSFTGDGSGLTGITADTATTLTGFDVTEYNTYTEGIDTFTGSIQTQVDANTALTASTLRLENDQTTVKQYSIPVFEGATPNTVSTGSDTFRVTHNPSHFPSGRGGTDPVNDLNNGSGSYYLYVQSASVGEDLYVGGDIDLIGTINNIVGFNFYEGNITTVSGAVQFGSGSTPADINLSGDHQFTGSLKITGGLYVDKLTESNQNKIVVYDETSGQFFYTGSLGGGLVQGGTIGEPEDGTYTDGYFSNFTSATTIGTAIDEISEAFALLAPAKADLISATALTRPTAVDAKLSDGLNSTNYYVFGQSAGSTVKFLNASSFTPLLNSAVSNLFHIGTSTDYNGGTLVGGFSSSVAYQGSVDNVSLPYGTNANATVGNAKLTLSNAQEYTADQPTWAAQEARIDVVSLGTNAAGGVKVTLSGSGANDGKIDMDELWVAAGTEYPDINVSNITVNVASLTTKNISGVTYYNGGDVEATTDVTNLYAPVYTEGNNISVTSTAFSNFNKATIGTGGTPPQYNDALSSYDLTDGAGNGTLSSNYATPAGQLTPATLSVTVSKPGGESGTNSANIGIYPINTYSSTQDTLGNSNVFNFLDEYYRQEGAAAIKAGTVSGYSSGTSLTGEARLQVVNGLLAHGVEYSYTGASEPSNASFYFRKITPETTFRETARFSNLDFTGFDLGKIGPFGSALTSNNGIQMALVLGSDIDGVNNIKRIFDLGRELGVNALNQTVYGETLDIIGAGVGANGNLSTLEDLSTFTISLANGSQSTIGGSAYTTTNTGTGQVSLWIVMRKDGTAVDMSTSTDNFISGMTFNWTV